MKKSLLVASSIILSLFMTACSYNSNVNVDEKEGSAQNVGLETVEGSLSYRERIALPATAVVSVTLEDISIADRKAVVISQDSFTTGGKQVPFNFKLDYQPSQIKANHTYAVRAKISVNGKLRFTTDTVKRVITDKDKTQQVKLNLISAK